MEPKIKLPDPATDDDHLGGYEYAPSTISLGPSFGSNTIGATSYPYTVTGTTSYPNVTISAGTGISSPWATNLSSKIKLDGKDADIEINGISLLKIMQEIQNRLNMLQPNTALEAEWDQLRKLGEQYRALEAKLTEQGKMWSKLKAMPPPDIG
jgi:hypothetical protein